MKTKEEAKKANLGLIISDQIDLIAPFLKKSTLPINPEIQISYELIGYKDTSSQSISNHLPNLLAQGKNKSIYVLDDGHWLGLYYNAGEKKLYFIDSYGHEYKDYKNTTEQITESLKEYPGITIENLYKQKIQFTEHDKENCGRFVGMALVLLDHGVKPEEFQRLDSSVAINTPRMTNASLALAQEIDDVLFSPKNKGMADNVKEIIAPKKLQQALNKYIQVVNEEVKQNIITTTADIIGVLKKTDAQQAQKLEAVLQNFIEAPDLGNAKSLEEMIQEELRIRQKEALSPAHPEKPHQDIDHEGFLSSDLQKAIEESLKSNTSPASPNANISMPPHFPNDKEGVKHPGTRAISDDGFSQDEIEQAIKESLKGYTSKEQPPQPPIAQGNPSQEKIENNNSQNLAQTTARTDEKIAWKAATPTKISMRTSDIPAPEVKDKSTLKAKLYACIESIRLFTQTAKTTIAKPFRRFRRNSQSKERGE